MSVNGKLSLEITPDVEFMCVRYPADEMIDGGNDKDYYVRPLWEMHDPTTFIDKPSHPLRKIDGVNWFECSKSDYNDPCRAFYLEMRAKVEDSYRKGYKNAQIDCAINAVSDPKIKEQIERLKYE